MRRVTAVRTKLELFFSAILIALFLILFGSISDAQSQTLGWHPACAGPPPCSATDDGYGGAETSLFHNYPDTTSITGTTQGYDAFGHLSEIGVQGLQTHIPYNTSGIAVAACTSPAFMSPMGCTTGPTGHQGSPQMCSVRNGQSVGVGAKVGDPINVSTGELYEEVTDFTTHGQDPLALVRSYNSDLNL